MPKQIVAMHYTESQNEEPNKISSLSLTSDINLNTISYWSNWGAASDCESGCLYGESGRLKEGSTGLKIYTRTCLDNRYVLLLSWYDCLSCKSKSEIRHLGSVHHFWI
jgi:hypothetical protein